MDFQNFENMLSIYQNLGVTTGSFKSLYKYIPDQILKSMLETKKDLSSSIPFKNVCWIFKVDDLPMNLISE